MAPIHNDTATRLIKGWACTRPTIAISLPKKPPQGPYLVNLPNRSCKSKWSSAPSGRWHGSAISSLRSCHRLISFGTCVAGCPHPGSHRGLRPRFSCASASQGNGTSASANRSATDPVKLIDSVHSVPPFRVKNLMPGTKPNELATVFPRKGPGLFKIGHRRDRNSLQGLLDARPATDAKAQPVQSASGLHGWCSFRPVVDIYCCIPRLLDTARNRCAVSCHSDRLPEIVRFGAGSIPAPMSDLRGRYVQAAPRTSEHA